VHDFPGGAARFVQRADGIDHTIVNGSPFMVDGEHTGALAAGCCAAPTERPACAGPSALPRGARAA
jgi:hypothetical protein